MPGGRQLKKVRTSTKPSLRGFHEPAANVEGEGRRGSKSGFGPKPHRENTDSDLGPQPPTASINPFLSNFAYQRYPKPSPTHDPVARVLAMAKASAKQNQARGRKIENVLLEKDPQNHLRGIIEGGWNPKSNGRASPPTFSSDSLEEGDVEMSYDFVSEDLLEVGGSASGSRSAGLQPPTPMNFTPTSSLHDPNSNLTPNHDPVASLLGLAAAQARRYQEEGREIKNFFLEQDPQQRFQDIMSGRWDKIEDRQADPCPFSTSSTFKPVNPFGGRSEETPFQNEASGDLISRRQSIVVGKRKACTEMSEVRPHLNNEGSDLSFARQDYPTLSKSRNTNLLSSTSSPTPLERSPKLTGNVNAQAELRYPSVTEPKGLSEARTTVDLSGFEDGPQPNRPPTGIDLQSMHDFLIPSVKIYDSDSSTQTAPVYTQQDYSSALAFLRSPSQQPASHSTYSEPLRQATERSKKPTSSMDSGSDVERSMGSMSLREGPFSRWWRQVEGVPNAELHSVSESRQEFPQVRLG